MVLNDSCPAEVSIILPVRNHIAFIDERIETIVGQTFQNWHCIVVDGFSTDGTWELIQEKIGTDHRFTLHQREPKGVYDAWNFGIEKATGKYIYIATSDDTMYENCISSFYDMLEKHPNCELAHCKLDIIDEVGKLIRPNPWLRYLPQKYYGSLVDEVCIRRAPVDGVLHAFLFTMYTSITQLFIRRRVFDELGYFSTEFGSKADFEWGMRVALQYNLLHIPESLATWRIHGGQLTEVSAHHTNKFYFENIRMVKAALKNYKNRVDHKYTPSFEHLDMFYRSRIVENNCTVGATKIFRMISVLRSFLVDPAATIYYYTHRGMETINIAKEFIASKEL